MHENNNDKRLIFVLGGLVGGGAERVAIHLINYWAEKNYKIKVITRLGPENDFFPIPEKTERVVLGDGGTSTNKLAGFFKNLPLIFKLRNSIKKDDAQIVISFLTKSNIHTILACFGLKKNVIISERNDTTKERHNWPWAYLRKLLYKHATLVTANSEIAIEGMRNYVPDGKLSVIPNPVMIPHKTSQPETSQYILSVGRLVFQKRHDVLVDAISKIEQKNLQGWKVNILGEGPDRKKLIEQTVSLNLTDSITFHGLIKNPEDYYHTAGIFVLTSEFEGTPNALLEALSFGLPCIISDGLTEAMKYVGNGINGFHFRAGDASDLANKLHLLINNSALRAQFGKQSQKRIEHLTIENIHMQWKKLFGKAAELN